MIKKWAFIIQLKIIKWNNMFVHIRTYLGFPKESIAIASVEIQLILT